MAKIGRNDPCPCGSGKKYKQCCLKDPKSTSAVGDTPYLTPVEDLDEQAMWEGEGDRELYEFDEGDDPLFSDETMERVLVENPIVFERVAAQILRIRREYDASEPGDLEPQIHEWIEKGELPDIPPETPLEEAQELMYKAWMSNDPDEQRRLAHQALEISSDCADAYTILAHFEDESEEEELALRRQAVAAGERAMQTEFEAEGLTEPTQSLTVRPLLRATVSLGVALLDWGHSDEGLQYLREALRIDPSDSQGARALLLGELLRQHDHTGARSILKQYEDDDDVSSLYGEALLAFQKHGAKRQAKRKAHTALEANPYFAACMLYVTPAELLATTEPYNPVDSLKRDAAVAVGNQMTAWIETPGALIWLRKEFESIRDRLDLDLWSGSARSSTSPFSTGADLPPTLGFARTEATQAHPGQPPAGDQAPTFDRRLIERHHANIQRALDQHDFETLEEANEYLNSIMTSSQPLEFEPRNELERAQNLIYEALEAEGDERIRLTFKALEVSPDCADAYVLLAEEASNSVEEALEYYEKGVAAGERALGPDAFREYAGEFWGALGTRPYMRARLGVAQCPELLERTDEAISHYEEMLRLNPNDNQGVRGILLPLYLETGRRGAAKRLIKQYPNDIMAIWSYSEALLSFMEHGPTKGTRRLLDKAIESNPYVPDYLLGEQELPISLPPVVSPGQPGDAVSCAARLLYVWTVTPGALAWLRDRVR